MSRSFMILFMVSVYTWLNKNSPLILNFIFIGFILWWKATFLTMELIVPFPDDILVSSDQLKRFDESVVDPKCLLRIYATSFCFGKNLSYSSNIIFSCILLFLFKKYGLHALQNGLELPSTWRFSMYCNLACLFRFATRYINFFGSKFSNFVLRIVYMLVITQTNFKEICCHKWKFRICN